MLSAWSLTTPKEELATRMNSWPSFLYGTMSIGWLPDPRSEIVTPFTCAPAFRSLTGIFTSGVQVYAARTYCWPSMVYGTNVRIGACVSYRPCDACQICSCVPLPAVLNG